MRTLAKFFALLTWLFGEPQPQGIKMNIQINDTQQTTLTISGVDAAGNAAVLTGVPTWSSSDDTVVTVTASADGLSAQVTSTGKLGAATITATADGFTASDEVTVVAGPLVGLTLAAGEPTAKLAPAAVDQPAT